MLAFFFWGLLIGLVCGVRIGTILAGGSGL
jgi:hypothetical protein